MIKIPKILTEEVFEQALEQLKLAKDDHKVVTKLKAIISIKKCGLKTTAIAYNVTENAIRNWLKAFITDPINGLKHKPGQGRKADITEEYMIIIKNMVDKNPNITIKEIVIRLKNEHNFKTGSSVTHRALQALNLSYITPRPVHHKQVKTSHEGFKKKS